MRTLLLVPFLIAAAPADQGAAAEAEAAAIREIAATRADPIC